MEGIVLLSGESPHLALAELEGALKAIGSDVKIGAYDPPIVVLSDGPPSGLADRMAFCHFTGSLSARAHPDVKSILEASKEVLSTMPKGTSVTFKVRSTRTSEHPEASDIFLALEGIAREAGLTVKHRGGSSTLFIVVKDIAYIGWTFERTDRKRTMSRKGSLMPFGRPIVMDPRLARAMVNLSGLREGSLVLDPFLGMGGLAMEASLLGLKVKGIERDPNILNEANANISHLGLADRIETVQGDSRDLTDRNFREGIGPIDGIITDPPFGRSSPLPGGDPGGLLLTVLEGSRSLLRTGAPLVFDTDDPDILGQITDYTIEAVLPFRVHRSMTRYMTVLRAA